MEDKYWSFEELKLEEKCWKDFQNYGSFFGDAKISLLAIHGWWIEPWTEEIVRDLYDILSDISSFYVFAGRKNSGNKDLHIKSIHFDDPLAIAVVSSSEFCCSFHGFDSEDLHIIVWGIDEKLKQEFAEIFQKKLKNNNLQDIKIEIRSEWKFSATDEKNIVNCSRLQKGIQLELSNGLRKEFFVDLNSRRWREQKTSEYWSFIQALSDYLSEI